MSDKHKNNDMTYHQHTRQAAELIETRQQEILNRWVDAVIECIPVAKGRNRSELGNHLQNLLDNVIRALNEIGDVASPMDLNQLSWFGQSSSLHGRERASMQGYTVGHVVHEYLVLRHTLTNFCAENKLTDSRTREIIALTIEHSALNAVNEFVKSIQEIQQKLISTLVHDVRTPLGVAHNYVEILLHTELPEKQRAQAAQSIAKNLQRAGSMLEEMLDTVKMEAGHGLFMCFEEGDLNDALSTVCKEANQLYGENAIQANLVNHPVVGIFDMALVIRTVENLISNAVKFGDKQSPVNVCLEDHVDHVLISVHNYGNPILEADVDRIFNFFSSTHDSDAHYKSWGLGLSLIKIVAKNHGGEVTLSSSADKGTTFGVTLYKRFRQHGDELSVLI